MRSQQVKYIKNVKEIISFLNKTFPSTEKHPKFIAYLPSEKSEDLKLWHIVTDDYLLYSGKDGDSEELKICYQAIRKKFKGFKMIFCYQYYITTLIHKNTLGYILVK